MSKWLAAIWLANIIPLIMAGASGGPRVPWADPALPLPGHAIFHVGYIVASLLGIALIRSFVRSTPNVVARRLSIALIAAQLLFIAGQMGELIVVLSHQGPRAGVDALADPLHDIPAMGGTGPGFFLTALVLIALTIYAIAMSHRAAPPAVAGR